MSGYGIGPYGAGLYGIWDRLRRVIPVLRPSRQSARRGGRR
jgi:hypothetical protein